MRLTNGVFLWYKSDIRKQRVSEYLEIFKEIAMKGRGGDIGEVVRFLTQPNSNGFHDPTGRTKRNKMMTDGMDFARRFAQLAIQSGYHHTKFVIVLVEECPRWYEFVEALKYIITCDKEAFGSVTKLWLPLNVFSDRYLIPNVPDLQRLLRKGPRPGKAFTIVLDNSGSTVYEVAISM